MLIHVERVWTLLLGLLLILRKLFIWLLFRFFWPAVLIIKKDSERIRNMKISVQFFQRGNTNSLKRSLQFSVIMPELYCLDLKNRDL